MREPPTLKSPPALGRAARPVHPPRRRARQGFTLIETTACIIMLGIAIGMVTQVVHQVVTHRRATERRSTALLEADNQLERLLATRSGSGFDATASPAQLSELARGVLPSCAMTVESRNDGEMTRLTVTINWEERPGRQAPPVRLTTWVDGGENSPRGAKP